MIQFLVAFFLVAFFIVFTTIIFIFHFCPEELNKLVKRRVMERMRLH